MLSNRGKACATGGCGAGVDPGSGFGWGEGWFVLVQETANKIKIITVRPGRMGTELMYVWQDNTG